VAGFRIDVTIGSKCDAQSTESFKVYAVERDEYFKVYAVERDEYFKVYAVERDEYWPVEADNCRIVV
jgi:hypothetical protein